MAYKPQILTVPFGGTGDTSTTAYAVLAGGTTSTGALQSIASVGTSGQVLTSNGASALPTFQTGPAMVLLSSQTASSSATLDFTSFVSASYTSYRVKFVNVLPATNSQNFWMLVSTDNGSTFLSSNCQWSTAFQSRTVFQFGSGVDNDGQFVLIDGVGNTDSSFSGAIDLYDVNAASIYFRYFGNLMYAPSGSFFLKYSAGCQKASAQINALRFKFASGNIASGTIELYGVV